MISTREVKKNTAATDTSTCLDWWVITSNLLVIGVLIINQIFFRFTSQAR